MSIVYCCENISLIWCGLQRIWVVMFVYSILFVFFRLRFLFIVIKKNEKKEKKRKCVRIMHTYDYFCCWEQCEMGTCVVCVDSTLSTAKTKINNNFQEYNCTGCLNVSEWVWKKWFSFFVCLFSKFQWRLRLICDADENFIQPILFFGTFLSVVSISFFVCNFFFSRRQSLILNCFQRKTHHANIRIRNARE